MKRIPALLFAFALAYALPCFGGTTEDFSGIPSWVKRDSLKHDSIWISTAEKRNPASTTSYLGEIRKSNYLLEIPKQKPRIAFSYFKVQDPRLGAPPTDRDYNKVFFSPLQNDFNNFLEREFLRIRPSLMLDDNWKFTVQKLRLKNSGLEGGLMLERKY